MSAKIVPQISVFVSNRLGMLRRALEAIGDGGGVLCCSLPESECFGVMRALFADPASGASAARRLEESGFRTKRVEVLLVEGASWAIAAAELAEAGVDVEYMYAFGDSLVLKVRRESMGRAMYVLGASREAAA